MFLFHQFKRVLQSLDIIERPLDLMAGVPTVRSTQMIASENLLAKPLVSNNSAPVKSYRVTRYRGIEMLIADVRNIDASFNTLDLAGMRNTEDNILLPFVDRGERYDNLYHKSSFDNFDTLIELLEASPDSISIIDLSFNFFTRDELIQICTVAPKTVNILYFRKQFVRPSSLMVTVNHETGHETYRWTKPSADSSSMDDGAKMNGFYYNFSGAILARPNGFDKKAIENSVVIFSNGLKKRPKQNIVDGISQIFTEHLVPYLTPKDAARLRATNKG